MGAGRATTAALGADLGGDADEVSFVVAGFDREAVGLFGGLVPGSRVPLRGGVPEEEMVRCRVCEEEPARSRVPYEEQPAGNGVRAVGTRGRDGVRRGTFLQG